MTFYKVSLDTWKKFNEQRDTRLPVLDEKNYMKIVKPKRSTKYSAGYDFYLPFDITLKAGESIVIPTGIKAYLPNSNMFLAIYPRSSLGFKYGMKLKNQTGIIDWDYKNNPDNEGHIMVAFSVDKDLSLPMHSRFCQGIIQQYFVMEDEDEDSLPTRTGGIGSTDKLQMV